MSRPFKPRNLQIAERKAAKRTRKEARRKSKRTAGVILADIPKQRPRKQTRRRGGILPMPAPSDVYCAPK